MYNILGLFSGFYNTMWKIAFLIAIVVLIGYCLRYKNGKIIIVTVICAVVLGFTTYCGVQLDRHYSARGGIFGQLKDWYNPNEVVVSDDVSFSFKNLALTKDGDIYSAKITSDKVLNLELEDDLTYGVYVNGMPCNYVEITKDYVLAEYRYAFYDVNFNALIDDTLSFKFAFYVNSTYLQVSTNGGADCIKYWNNYFNKNLFEVTIDNKGYDYSQEIQFGTGDTSEYSVVSYYLDDELSFKQIYKNGTMINLPEQDKYVWKFDAETLVAEDYMVTGSVSLYAYPFTLSFDATGGELDITSKSLYGTELFGELPVPTRTDYEFAGWYTKDGVLATSTSVMGLSDITLYAHWTSPVYNVLCEYNEATSTYVVTGSEYTDATTITIPSTYNDGVNGLALVTEIKAHAFYNNKNITEVVLPDSLLTIGSYAFAGCSNLKAISFPAGLTTIERLAFNDCGLEQVIIPKGLTSVGESVFQDCKSLVSVEFEEDSACTSLGYGAFAYCTNLTNVTLPESLQIVGQGAFYGCTSLNNIILPASVTKIVKGAFQECSNLITMTILSVVPPILESTNAISSATTTIYIVGELDVYANANNWSNFTSKFVKI